MKSGTRLQSFRHLSSFRTLFSVILSGWLTGLGSAAQAQTLDTQQIATLNPTSPAADDRFGSAVTVSGDTLIIGARGYDGTGAVFIFERDSGGVDQWGQTAVVVPSDAAEGDRFGHAVTIEGDLLVVGSIGDDDPNPTAAPGTKILDAAGSVYFFERDVGGPGQWGQVDKLVASNGEIFDNFGFDLALSGSVLAVSAWTEEETQATGCSPVTCSARSGVDAGVVYVYERNAGTGAWEEQAFIESPREPVSTAEAFFDNYGRRVALSGDTLVVSASEEDISDADQGTVYIYERNAGGPNQWGEVAVLRAGDGRRFDRFGRSVAIDGDTVVIGSTGDDDAGSGSGSAFIFQRIEGQWVESVKLLAEDGIGFERFGEMVAIDGETIIVGAPDQDDMGAKSGAIYVFQRDEGGPDQWGQVAKITATDAVEDDRFGLAGALAGNTLVTGVFQKDDNGEDSGAAYLFELGGEPSSGYEDIFSGGPDLGAGWHFSDWFGIYNVNFFAPWLFHLEHGWMFLADSSTSSEMFLFDLSSEAWYFTGQTQYPNMFSFSRSSWVFYFEESANPRNFVDLGSGDFFDLP